MYIWVLMNRAITLLACLFVSTLSFTQTIKTLQLDIQGEPLDLINFNNSGIHLVSSNAVYRLFPGELKKVSNFHTLVTSSSNKYTVNEKLITYPLLEGGLARIDKNQFEHFLGNSRQSTVAIYKDEIWHIDTTLRRFHNNYWEEVLTLDDDENPYWDICSTDSYLWLANYGSGVYKIDSLGIEKEFNTGNGLFDNQCTSIAKLAKGVIVGHKGGISIIDDDIVKAYPISEQIFNEAIIEIEVRKDSAIYLLTPTKILKGSPSGFEFIPIELEQNDEWVAIQYDNNDNLWLLSKTKLTLITDNSLTEFIPVNPARQQIQLYEIRKNQYYTNGSQVYRFDPGSGKWVLNPRKRAPVNVIRNKDGHSILSFEDGSGIKIHNDNARILRNYIFPEGEKINDIGESDNITYLATNKNLYTLNKNNYELISAETDKYFKFLESAHGKYVFAENSIYRIDGTSIVEILPAFQNKLFPESTNQFEYNSCLVTFTEHAIVVHDLKENKSFSVELSPLKILDIRRNENQLVILSAKSVVRLNLTALLDQEVDFISVNPLNDSSEDGRLYSFDDRNFWIASSSNITKLGEINEAGNVIPELGLSGIHTDNSVTGFVSNDNVYEFKLSDLPLQFEFDHSNFWSDEVQYTFHLGSKAGNSSQWYNKPEFILDNAKAGSYVLTAKMRDDVYGQNIFSEPIYFTIKKPGLKNTTVLIIVPLLLLLLFLLSKLVQRI